MPLNVSRSISKLMNWTEPSAITTLTPEECEEPGEQASVCAGSLDVVVGDRLAESDLHRVEVPAVGPSAIVPRRLLVEEIHADPLFGGHRGVAGPSSMRAMVVGGP